MQPARIHCTINGKMSQNTMEDYHYLAEGNAYRSDPKIVREALLAVAKQHSGVLQDPKPDVMLDDFGDSAMNFSLRVWTREYSSRPGVLKSELNYLIYDCFKERGIEIPFPQRDVHIKQLPKDLGQKT